MTVELFFGMEDGGPLEQRLRHGQLCLVSVRGPGKSDNEDSALVLEHDQGLLLAVADGMGGLKAGGRASRVALETLAEHVLGALEQGISLRHGVLDGIAAANRAVLELKLGAGTTLVAVVVQEGRAQPLHAGDSVALHVGQRGRVRTSTTPHSPTGYLVEAGMMEEEEALHDEERHLVSNYLGWEGMHIEVGAPRRVQPRDTLLLASDGLVDNLAPEEIVERIRRGPMVPAASALRQLALARMAGGGEAPGKPDDLTFLLYRP